jgi:small-conductance mechanosensitive channel
MYHKSVILAVYSAALAKLNHYAACLGAPFGPSEIELGVAISNLKLLTATQERGSSRTVAHIADVLQTFSSPCEGDPQPELGALQAILAADSACRTTEVSPLERRVAAIEAREARLAILFSQITDLEKRLRERIAAVRSEQVKSREVRRIVRTACSQLGYNPPPADAIPFVKDDEEVIHLRARLQNLHEAIRAIRSQPVGA